MASIGLKGVTNEAACAVLYWRCLFILGYFVSIDVCFLSALSLVREKSEVSLMKPTLKAKASKWTYKPFIMLKEHTKR